MHAISTRPGRVISARALRLGLLAAVATPALLVSTVGTASASKGAYPPAMDCSTSASIGTESGSASGASCGVAATTVTNPNLAPAGQGNGNAGNAGAANAGTPGQPQGTQAGLAFTGSDVTTPAVLAGGLIVGGLLVTVGARRRRSH